MVGDDRGETLIDGFRDDGNWWDTCTQKAKIYVRCIIVDGVIEEGPVIYLSRKTKLWRIKTNGAFEIDMPTCGGLKDLTAFF